MHCKVSCIGIENETEFKVLKIDVAPQVNPISLQVSDTSDGIPALANLAIANRIQTKPGCFEV